MGILDQVGQTAKQAADRIKFEAEKFHRTSRIQGELSDLKQQLDQKLIEMGQRTYDLYRAGQLSMASFADLVRDVDQLRIGVTRKEDELRIAQSEIYPDPTPAPPPAAQPVPIYDASGQQQPPQHQPPVGYPQPAPAPFPQQSAPHYPQPAPAPLPQQPVPGPVPGLFQPQPAAGGAPQPPAAGAKKTCPSCGFEMPMQARFCPKCGYRVGG